MTSIAALASASQSPSPWHDRLKLATLPNGLPIWEINHHETEFLYSEIFQQDLYFRRDITLTGDAVVFDVGANIGMFSLLVRQRCPDATILAFEPSPIAAEALRRNTETVQGQMHVYECGVSSQNGSSALTFYPGYTILSGFHAQAEADRSVLHASIRDEANRRGMSKWLTNGAIDRLAQQKLGQPIHIACPMRTLSSIINEHQLDRVDLLKIDAERCELEILDGITSPHWSRIQQVVMEVHDQAGGVLDQIVRLLKNAGFQVGYEQQADGSQAGLFDLYAVRR